MEVYCSVNETTFLWVMFSNECGQNNNSSNFIPCHFMCLKLDRWPHCKRRWSAFCWTLYYALKYSMKYVVLSRIRRLVNLLNFKQFKWRVYNEQTVRTSTVCSSVVTLVKCCWKIERGNLTLSVSRYGFFLQTTLALIRFLPLWKKFKLRFRWIGTLRNILQQMSRWKFRLNWWFLTVVNCWRI